MVMQAQQGLLIVLQQQGGLIENRLGDVRQFRLLAETVERHRGAGRESDPVHGVENLCGYFLNRLVGAGWFG